MFLFACGGGSSPSPPPANHPPTASVAITPLQGVKDSTVFTYTINASDADNDALKYDLDFEGDGIWDLTDQSYSYGQLNQVQNVFSTSGTFTGKIRVTDSKDTLTATMPTITVEEPAVNNPPSISGSATPSSGIVNQTTFTFTTYPSDPDGDNVEVRVDFDGDGTWDTAYSSQTTFTHVYPSTGTYTAKMQARDDKGLESAVENFNPITVNPVPTFNKTFIVKDAMTLDPIPDVDIILSDGNGNVYIATTDSNGRAVLSLTEGTWYISTDEDRTTDIGTYFNFSGLPVQINNDNTNVVLFEIPNIPMQVHTTYPTFLDFLTGYTDNNGDHHWGLMEGAHGVWGEQPILWYLEEGTPTDEANLQNYFNELNLLIDPSGNYMLFVQTYTPLVPPGISDDWTTQQGIIIKVGEQYPNQTSVDRDITLVYNICGHTTMGYSHDKGAFRIEIYYRELFGKNDGTQDIDSLAQVGRGNTQDLNNAIIITYRRVLLGSKPLNKIEIQYIVKD